MIGSRRRVLSWGAAVPVLLLSPVGPPASAEPLTRAQLVALAKDGIATAELVARVKRECVGFPMDAQATLDLSKLVPAEVLQAAIDCQRAPAPAVPAVPPAAPAAAAAAAAPAPPPAVVPAPAPKRPAAPAAAAAATAPAPAPPAAPQAPARLRVAAFHDVLDDLGYGSGAPERCLLLVDYAGDVKAVPRGKGRRPDPSYREKLAGAAVHEVAVGAAKAGPNEARVEVAPGPHTVSLYCNDSWKRQDVQVDAAPGADLRVVVRYRFGAELKIAGVEPDGKP